MSLTRLMIGGSLLDTMEIQATRVGPGRACRGAVEVDLSLQYT